MFGKTVYEHEIGPLSYRVKSPRRGEFTLWCGGCRIGKPQANGDVWEFTAKTLGEAKDEMRAHARRSLLARIKERLAEVEILRTAVKQTR